MQAFYSLNELESAFANFREQTFTQWCIAKSLPNFRYPVEKVIYNEKNRLVWHFQITKDQNPVVVHFNGTPLMSAGRVFHVCHRGKDKDANRKKFKKELNILQKKATRNSHNRTKKMGCSSKFTFIRVIKFPDFQVGVDASSEEKREALQLLREALFEERAPVSAVEVFFASFPKSSSHNHVVGKEQSTPSPNEGLVEYAIGLPEESGDNLEEEVNELLNNDESLPDDGNDESVEGHQSAEIRSKSISFSEPYTHKCSRNICIKKAERILNLIRGASDIACYRRLNDQLDCVLNSLNTSFPHSQHVSYRPVSSLNTSKNKVQRKRKLPPNKLSKKKRSQKSTSFKQLTFQQALKNFDFSSVKTEPFLDENITLEILTT